jgi:hypothetical protein
MCLRGLEGVSSAEAYNAACIGVNSRVAHFAALEVGDPIGDNARRSDPSTCLTFARSPQ